jgi:GTP pyrophosphokinase
VRILVDDVKDCYAALGSVHHLWTPLPREFDDYIAKPKANHYRSLHTAVIGPRASRSRCRSARGRCTSTRNTAWLRTGATRKAAPKGMRRDPAFEDRIAGCARCSTGRTPSSTRPTGSRRSRAASSRTPSTC